MIRFLKGCLSILVVLFIAGCGGGTTGTGNTVFIQGSVKQGTTGAIFANFSGAVFANISGTRLNPVQSANLMNFTIKSTPTSNSGGTIKNSDVNISNVTWTFTPVPNNLTTPPTIPPTFIPVSPSFSYAGSLTPGGSLDIDNVPVLWDEDIRQIVLLLGNQTGIFQYRVDITFTGIEVNTGAVLKNTINVSAILQKK